MAKKNEEKVRFGKSISEYKKALELNSSPEIAGKIYTGMALAYKEKGLLNDAISCCEKALELNIEPDTTAKVYSALTGIYAAKGDDGYALFYCKKALDINQDDPVSLYNLGVIYFNQRLNNLSVAALKRSLELDQDNADAFYYLGLCYKKKGQLDDAFKAWQKASEITPGAGAGVKSEEEIKELRSSAAWREEDK